MREERKRVREDRHARSPHRGKRMRPTTKRVRQGGRVLYTGRKCTASSCPAGKCRGGRLSGLGRGLPMCRIDRGQR